MALTRTKTWTREKLLYSDLNTELNNFMNYINAFGVTNPLSGDLDLNDNFILNASFYEVMRVRNAQSYSNGIQGAIDSLIAEGTSEYQGGIVFCPPGLYDLSAMINMADDVYVVGSGWKTIITKDYDATSYDSMFDFNGTTHSGVSNLYVWGEGTENFSNGVAGIRVDNGSSDIYIDKVLVHQMGGGGSDTTSFQNDGVYIGNTASSNRIWVTNSRFISNGRNGISVTWGTNIYLLNNKCASNEHAGIDVEPETTNSQSINGLIISGNALQSNATEGMVVGNGATSGATDFGVKRAIISNNDSFACTNGRGMYIKGINGGAITGNSVQDNGDIGIEINQSKGLSVTGNSIVGNGADGMTIGTDQDASMVTTNIALVGNTIKDNDGTGLNLGKDSGTTSEIMVDGNHFHENGAGAVADKSEIAVASITGLSICNNRMVRVASANGRDGINLSDASVDVILTGNFTKGHVGYGLRVNARPTGEFVIANNAFTDAAPTSGI